MELTTGSGYLHQAKQSSPNFKSTPLIKENHTKDLARLSTSSYQPVSLKFSQNSDTTPYSEKLYTNSPSFQLASSIHSSGPKSGESYRKSFSPSSSKLSDVDCNTIIRQRHELQLMIRELKDRDRELNELVSSHHQQLVAWELDRQRLDIAEKQIPKYRVELKKRYTQCKILKDRIKLYESNEISKSKELDITKTELEHLSTRIRELTTQVKELKAKNETLKSSVGELTRTIATVQAKDQQISTILRLKDKDIVDANKRIEDLTLKLQRSNDHLLEFKQKDEDRQEKLERLSIENNSLKQNVQQLKETVVSQSNTSGESREEIADMKQELIMLQKELLLSGEREKRKDSLLDLSRSKQGRTDIELKQLRKLCETLQTEHVQMKEQIFKQDDDDMSIITTSDIDSLDPMRALGSFDKMTMLEQSTSESLERREQQQLEEKENLENKRYDDNKPISNNGRQSTPYASKKNVDASFESTDVGEMTTAELKNPDIIPSYLLTTTMTTTTISSKIDEKMPTTIDQDDSLSPTSRLHKLLSQSREMVKNLENSHEISSLETTPDKLERIGMHVESGVDLSTSGIFNFMENDEENDSI